jgi:DNA-binding winged helix-turn-helix (wHTH) protein
VIDEAAHTVERAGTPVELTAIEFALLATFSRHRSQVLSKTQLLTMVWGFDQHKVNLVEVHVSALRRKLESAGPRIIHTVRGAGYALRPVEGVEPAAKPARARAHRRSRCEARHSSAFRPLRRRSLGADLARNGLADGARHRRCSRAAAGPAGSTPGGRHG